jgi:hypothetical protein
MPQENDSIHTYYDEDIKEYIELSDELAREIITSCIVYFDNNNIKYWEISCSYGCNIVNVEKDDDGVVFATDDLGNMYIVEESRFLDCYNNG